MRTTWLLSLASLATLVACGGPTRTDFDDDGFTADVDCDDFNESIGAERTWYLDTDGDGYGDAAQSEASCDRPEGYVARAGDCDLEDPGISPSAEESCNGIDDDCDGFIDENTDKGVWYADADGDGFGDPGSEVDACDGEEGLVANARDCDDSSADIRPGADEVCDGVDNDCDARVDEPDAVDASTWTLDSDGDGYGRTSTAVVACDAPSDAWASEGADCNDDDAGVNPGAEEQCDGFDNNCDGRIDDATATDATTWYADADGDGFGRDDRTLASCSRPDGYVAAGGDCDDRNRFLSPDTLWFVDDDADGFGTPDSSTASCTDPSDGSTTYVDNFRDCDDGDDTVNPRGTEECDGIDNDCDGVTDGADAIDATTYYMDFDGDGYGSPERTGRACSAPDGFTTDNTDCDDDNGFVYPGADEFCDGIDNDCDRLVDFADPDVTSLTWYEDADEDTFGNASVSTESCTRPTGYVLDDTDCDDTNRDVNPDAIEVCDAGLDNDCDGLVDTADPDMSGDGTWYRDADADGYGDKRISVTTCTEPSGYVRNDDDCDDADASKWNTCWSGQRVFTTCSATGHDGPGQSACDSAYSGTTLDGEVTVSGGIQEWTVPQDGTYRIEVWGAQGASGTSGRQGGLGARIRGDFDLDEGDLLQIVVGQKGVAVVNQNGGGGGGSFVVDGSDNPLIIAGGGSGIRTSASQNGCDAKTGQYAGTGRTSSTHTCTTKGSDLGLGGRVSRSWGSGGAGFNGDGANDASGRNCSGACGGKSWGNGMTGGNATSLSADGGFGGGGAGNGFYGGGGGGGYSGGDSGWIAGGGGSYNTGDNAQSQAGARSGDGRVTIDWLP